MSATKAASGEPSLHLLGVRHHGPGSARSVVAALDELAPAMVLIEAPFESSAAFRWIGHEHLVPPVALLGWVPDEPRRAVFAPFASFSPEWQAVGWANRNHVEVRAIDLPLGLTLAERNGVEPDADDLFADGSPPVDPIAELARAAGEADPERWWDDVIEHRGDGLPAFTAVAEAMAAVREGFEPSRREARREAHMRRAIRTALRDVARAHGSSEPELVTARSVVVVCGAWHVPALHPSVSTASADAAILRGLPKTKVAVSWVPWTHQRLGSADYAAGVRSPGWYDHVFRYPGGDGVARFVVEAAGLLRAAGRSASPDHLVAATRLADTLAALRSRPRAGLDEVLDATDAVMGGLPLVRDQLVVGHAVGSVPNAAPQVPLARDVAVQQRRVRLKVADQTKSVELDLRTPNGLARSHLLHRLDALGVAWGVLEEGRGSSGTFRETWTVRWTPELSVRLVEMAGHGITLEQAATSALVERSSSATSLAEVATLVDAALVASLPDAVSPIVSTLSTRAATAPDLGGVLDALGPLARARRYGDVRSTDARSLEIVFDGLVVRALAGLVAACRSLDDDAATGMAERISSLRAALALVDHPARHEGLPEELVEIADGRFHGLVRGRAARLLHDGGHGHVTDVGRRLGRALGQGTPPAEGARFVEGFLAGSGTVLLHDADLLAVVDGWMAGLEPETFAVVVPLLRRTFGAFEPAERRRLGQLLAGHDAQDRFSFGPDLDPERAELALATVRALLGLPLDAAPSTRPS